MPYLFQWETNDHRQVGWSDVDKRGNPLNAEGYGEVPPDILAVSEDRIRDQMMRLYWPDFVPDERYWPLKFRQSTKHKKLPDFMNLASSNTLLMSRRAKHAIESLEPDVHIFVPLELTTFAGDVLRDEYFFFRIGSFVDQGLVEENSQIGWSKSDYSGKKTHYYGKTISPILVWKKEKIEGRHIWADRLFLRGLCISDELADEFRKQKMKFMDLTKGGVE